MSSAGKKIRCRKCKKNYYKVGVGRASCPYCARDALVPNGTISILNLKIQPGGYDDDELCLKAGLGTKAKSGAIYLRGVATVVSRDHKDKKFTIPIGISGNKSDYWQNKGHLCHLAYLLRFVLKLGSMRGYQLRAPTRTCVL